MRAQRRRTRRRDQEWSVWMRYGFRHQAAVALEEIDNAVGQRLLEALCDVSRRSAGETQQGGGAKDHLPRFGFGFRRLQDDTGHLPTY